MRLLFASALLLTSAAAASPALAQGSDGREFSGLYAGGSLGVTIQDDDEAETILFDRDLDGTFGENITTAAGANAFTPGFCTGSVNGPVPPTGGCDREDRAFEFSGRLGFDWQVRSVVFGVLGEIGKTDANSSVTAFSTTPASYTITREIDYLANLRGRIGVTVTPTTLLYATAGAAYAKLDNGFSTTNLVNAVSTSGDDESWGYVLGLGAEQKLGRNLSIGLEYLHNQLEDENFRVRLSRGSAPATNPFVLGNSNGTDFARSNDDFRLHSLRAVANLRF